MKGRSLSAKGLTAFLTGTVLALTGLPVTADVSGLYPGIVKVTTPRETGTGFVVQVHNHIAYIATAQHVVAGQGEAIQVTFPSDPQRPRAAQTVNMDAGLDLAVLKVHDVPATVILPLDAEPSVQPGEPVYLVGFPRLTQSPQLRHGVLSGRDGSSFVVHVGADGGDSGGPIIRDGRVIAIATRADQKFAFAVPMTIARMAFTGWAIPFSSEIQGTAKSFPCAGTIRQSIGGSKRLYSIAARGASSQTIRTGADVKVLNKTSSEAQTWYQVTFEATHGWVPKKDLELSSQCP